MPGITLKSGARSLMRSNSPKIFFVSAVYVAIITIMSELQFRLPGTIDAYDQYIEQLSSGKLQDLGMMYSYLRPSGVPFAIVLWLLSAVILVGYMSYSLKISRSQTAEYKDIFDGFLFFGKIIAIKIVTNILIFLWSLLLVFPGVIAYYRYRQAYYILLDDPKKPVFQCINESARLMQRNKLELFLLDLSFFGWYCIDLLVVVMLPLPFSLPLISIWLTPYINLTHAAFYNQLIGDITV